MGLLIIRDSLNDGFFFFFLLCMTAIIVAACIIGVKQQKPRAPGPYSEELRKLRRQRKLL